MEEKGFLRTNLERKRRGNGSSLKDKRDYRKFLFTFYKNKKDLNIFVGKVAQYKKQGCQSQT